jgi:hypothetical protein
LQEKIIIGHFKGAKQRIKQKRLQLTDLIATKVLYLGGKEARTNQIDEFFHNHRGAIMKKNDHHAGGLREQYKIFAV